MKYIFLDIDGVIKPSRCYFRKPITAEEIEEFTFGGFDPLAVDAVNRLAKKCNAHVVFNTTWNRYPIVDIAIKQGLTAPIAGKTQYPYFTSRLMAIQNHIEKYPCDAWVALDDAVIDHPNALRIDSELGITPQNYRDATAILGNPDPFMVLL